MTASFVPPVVATMSTAPDSAWATPGYAPTALPRTTKPHVDQARCSSRQAADESAKGTKRIYRMTMRLPSLPMPSITVSTTSPAAR